MTKLVLKITEFALHMNRFMLINPGLVLNLTAYVLTMTGICPNYDSFDCLFFLSTLKKLHLKSDLKSMIIWTYSMSYIVHHMSQIICHT